MGGEIFKNSLRKLEANSIQKSQNNISLETRHNSLSNDIKVLKNESALADENLSQRPRKREINKFAYISEAFSRKITRDKSILASITYNNLNKIKEMISKSQNSFNQTKELELRTKQSISEMKVEIFNTKQINIPVLEISQSKIQFEEKFSRYNPYLIPETLIFGKDFHIILYILFNLYRIMINNIQLSSIVFDPGIDANIIKLKLFLHIYISYINSKNKCQVKIIYNTKIIMFLDEDTYAEFKETCVNLNNYAYNEEINMTKLRWPAFDMLFINIFRYKTYFNEKFDRLRLNIDDEHTTILTPNELYIFSAYIDGNLISNSPNWDFCAENFIYILRNLN